MANITVPGLPAKTGTILDAAYLHLNESSVDKKVTIAQLLAKIEAQYSADIVTFLGSANKAEGRANLSIDRRVTVDDANYTILATDKVVAQIGTMSAARTFSLPAASTVQAGAMIIIIDESGTITSTNKISVQRNGTDTIDGQTSIDINKDYGSLVLICDGSNSWKIISNRRDYQEEISLMVWRAADQTVTTGVITKVQLDTELIDVGGYFDNSVNYRWTPPAGRYLVMYGIQGIDGTVASQSIHGYLYLNGSQYQDQWMPFFDNGNATLTGMVILNMNGTDYLELFGSTGGSGATEFGGGRESFMAGYRISD
jgi:hypothetical protein